MSRFLVQLAMLIRRTLLRAADAMVPAGMLLLEHVFGASKTRLLEGVVKLGVAETLEKEGPLEANALALKVGANAEMLRRALRALAGYGVFKLKPDGRFANNRVSRALIPGRRGSVSGFIRYFSSESNSRAWANLESTLRTGKSAFEATYGLSVWEHFKKNPEEGTGFGTAMRELTELEAPVIARGYPFSVFRSICDVGGGSGALLAEIVRANPGIDVFVYDHAGPDETSARPGVRRVSGSFFETVPSGPDAYLLKDILHDWDDTRATHLLKTIRRACSPGQTLLVIEMLLGENSFEVPANLSDIHMMVACGGKQRSATEMKKLLTDAGFTIDRVVALPSTYSIIEARTR